ncbi:sensor histidine kinase [Acidomonas methanolica]|uniref:sensor histidine kinase n=1 Tax=Acidomonas methanolica TaxID=437 RepID=UPI00222E15DE|nr:HAMP domain-containing sensor histidine kinase [Acidomonas methanolica]
MSLASVRRLPVLRSSSFRIVGLFAACFLVSGLMVVALSGYHSQKLLLQQLRRTVAAERDEACSEAQGQDVPRLRPVIHELVRNEPAFYYLLQDGREQVVIGNMLHLRPVTGWRWLTWTHRTTPADHHPVIGYGAVLQDGGYFFVGIDATPLQSLRRDLWFTLAWSSIAFLLIGLGGGFILSRLVLGKIETISLTAREIMRGDMSRRLPLNGTGDEFDHLSGSLNAMLDRNEALIASVRQVSDDIAHDMRRPLARLAQHLDEATETPQPDRRDVALERAKGDLHDALEIFSSLLRLAQIEAGDRIPGSQTFPVADLFETIDAFYRAVAEDHGQTLAMSMPPPDMVIEGSRVLLVQMLSNLVENAINHSPSKTVISLSATTHEGGLAMVVADTGPGIPVDDRERVFEKMVRLDASRTVPGTGLGLSMVRAIVRLHGGTIRLDDNAPGLRCEITLPASVVGQT